MAEEILINFTPMETRVAVVENGVVQEVFLEREANRGRVGGIFKGKVVRVLPGMQAAFVDIGFERAAFVHANDIYRADVRKGEETKAVPNIMSLVREGQDLVVQVIKDQIGSKGARLTTHLSIPSRYLVFMPYANHVGISQRIEGVEERERLKDIIQSHLDKDDSKGGGIIVRTVGEGADEVALINDLLFLEKLWAGVSERIASTSAVNVIHEDLPLYLRTIRDSVREGVEKVRIDSRETYERIIDFVVEFIPEAESKIEYYSGERPVFDLYGVEDEIQKALGCQVQLKSGGYLVIDQTEAMTTVDVNTGAYVGHRNLEETIYKTNLEATHAIARQLRLRNLGGIIIVDFIDMEEEEHRRQVLRAFEKMLSRDHAKNKITQVSELGLVEMTRKRTRESLERMMCEPCEVCGGKGFYKTAQTVCYELFREVMREARAYDADSYMVIASQEVVDRLLDEESANVADLESFIGKTISFQVESLYSQEQFDIVLL